jgi:hypothetical protein
VVGVLVFMASQSSSSTGFDLVSVSISESGKYLPESRFNGATIAMVLLTKAHDFFGEPTKPDGTRAKILGQFGSGSKFRTFVVGRVRSHRFFYQLSRASKHR